MAEYEKKNYSCYCLYDVCCVAKAKKDSCEELSERIDAYIKLRYKKMKTSGHC